jgi:hypothetical protein
MGRKNINFKALARSMGVPTSTNTERINFNARGDEIEPDHYRRLLNQKETFHHPKLPILVVRTNYSKTIKLIDKIRCVHLKIYNNGEYPYFIYEGKVYKVHRVVAEAYCGRLVKNNEDVHHCNLNKYDYRFENLIILNKLLHKEFHCMLNKEV